VVWGVSGLNPLGNLWLISLDCKVFSTHPLGGKGEGQGFQELHAVLLVIRFPAGLQSSSYCLTTSTFILWPQVFSVHSLWTDRKGTPALRSCGEHIFSCMMGERLENLSPAVLPHQVNSSSLLLEIIHFRLFGRAV